MGYVMIEKFKKACKERGFEPDKEKYSLYCAGYKQAVDDSAKKHYGGPPSIKPAKSLFDQKREKSLKNYLETKDSKV